MLIYSEILFIYFLLNFLYEILFRGFAHTHYVVVINHDNRQFTYRKTKHNYKSKSFNFNINIIGFCLLFWRRLETWKRKAYWLLLVALGFAWPH